MPRESDWKGAFKKDVSDYFFVFLGPFFVYISSRYVIHGIFGLDSCSSSAVEKALVTLGPMFISIISLLIVHALLAVLVRFHVTKRHLIVAFAFIIIVGLFLGTGTFCIGKPVIYLYPEESMNATVKLITPGIITVSYPQYPPDGWNVHVEPSGIINGNVPYLFYEADVITRYDYDRGWFVSSSDVSQWFEEYLPRLGLNQRESRDFRDYWEAHLPPSEYYLITPINSEKLDRMVKLEIEPDPDTVIRVMLLIKPVNEPFEIEAPEIEENNRKGFTVVEWGVIIR
ncbi:MAG: hypothetical protein ABH851_08395 [Methanobacteriota archaeon]